MTTTNKAVIEMAREAGFWKDLFAYPEFKEHLERFVILVREDEREKQQEPVAWMDNDGNICDHNDFGCFNIPLYTTPPTTKAAVLAEREACAKVCEELIDREVDDAFDSGYNFGVSKCCTAIRARGETTEKHNKYYYDFDRNK